LIVEDDSLLSRLYQKEFSFRGYAVDVAFDGEAGLTRVYKFKPDLILLDLLMPKLGGLQVLEKLKGDEATKNIPVVILTNNPEDAGEALKKGALMYLKKEDQTPKEMVDKVEEVLKKK
ncbi:response regulator, partial [Candidatus Microgenomates bacterium]|nr:response regulator [Candidatus Microgenomates bacterium]